MTKEQKKILEQFRIAASKLNQGVELEKRRFKVKRKKNTFITFAEIEINFNQIGQICGPLSGLEQNEMIEYYQGKIHGNILLSESIFTTREDQPDIQYLFDLGVQALANGMKLQKEQSNQPELYLFKNEVL